MATMTTSTRQSTGSRTFRWTVTAILTLLGIATIGYIAVMPIEYAAPEMNEAAWFAVDGPMVASGSTSDQVDLQAAAGAATAATATVQTESAARPNFDNFPDQYVNHAAKTKDPTATF
jgi:hypothetical protein